MPTQLNHVSHNYLRYANCWEDADLLLEGLQVTRGDRVLSIGSAGDNSFSLLSGDPEFVIAVDVNKTQLHLIELKKACFTAFDHHEFLKFLGFKNCPNRIELFQKLKLHLPNETYDYWGKNLSKIQRGIIHQGKFERYFNLFRTKILPLIHSQKTIKKLFTEKTEFHQQQFYSSSWNTWRWRLLFKIFFSKIIMGRFGRDPEFLKEVKVPVSDFIFSQAQKHLSSVHCLNNYFLHYILLGTFGSQLPHYARKANFDIIKTRIDRLQIFHGYAEDACIHYSNFSKFNLSNIFEYMTLEMFESVVEKLTKCGERGARYAYWNLMVPRKMQQLHLELENEYPSSGSQGKIDNGFFYQKFLLDVKV